MRTGGGGEEAERVIEAGAIRGRGRGGDCEGVFCTGGCVGVRRGSSRCAAGSSRVISYRFEVRRRGKKVIASRPVDSFLDLKVGDSRGGARGAWDREVYGDSGGYEGWEERRVPDVAGLREERGFCTFLASRINLIQK